MSFLLGLFFPLLAIGQLPVTDVGLNSLMIQQSALRTQANTTMTSQLAESVEHTTQLTKTYQLMKEANDKLKTISSFIQKFSSITHILEVQKYQYNRIKNAIEEMKDSKYITAYELKILQQCTSNFLTNSNELISMANSIVTPGNSEMNDADRISILLRISEKIEKEATATNYIIKNLEEIENQRAAITRADAAIKRVFTGN